MKKKLAVLVLATSMVLCACGSEKEADAETSVEVEAEEEAETEAEVETEEEAETEVAEETSDYVKGIVTETGWESEWLGIRYTCPEGMKMATEEELNEIMGLGQEVLSEDFTEAQLKYAELASVYEMMSSDELGTTNFMITVEKLPMELTAAQYIEIVEQQLSAVSAVTYETVNNSEIVSIGGVDFTKLECVADYEGVVMHQDYYVTMKDNRAVAVVCTFIDETAETAQAAINGFAAY